MSHLHLDVTLMYFYNEEEFIPLEKEIYWNSRRRIYTTGKRNLLEQSKRRWSWVEGGYLWEGFQLLESDSTGRQVVSKPAAHQ